MPATPIDLDKAVELTRTGDVWLFRGRKVPDRAIQVTTNSPVNHVGMAVVIDDLPPLMWHAELGKSLPDMWSGGHHRGVQLHDLRSAVMVWAHRYGQRAWFRQLDPPATREMEDAVLRAVARLDGTPFPSTARLAGRWVRGRLPAVRLPFRRRDRARDRAHHRDRDRDRDRESDGDRGGEADEQADRSLETAYCAEVLAVTYEEMGLLPGGRRTNWYDPGRFWSGDRLELTGGHRLGGEIAVRIPDA
ncbi:hypothetical protein AB0K60_02415 [Thermopolyspora sp. NPDC052614]|uniref:hypothetical protein n=1 Tax=Thermopolyspora sp. NPDC052614 TaxID=3155682 RepID=UPI00344110ED